MIRTDAKTVLISNWERFCAPLSWDCLKKVSDVELLTDPLLSIARAVRYMVDEGMEVSFFDQMMAGITKLSDAQMQRTQTWQAAATQAVSRVFQDMSSLMKK